MREKKLICIDFKRVLQMCGVGHCFLMYCMVLNGLIEMLKPFSCCPAFILVFKLMFSGTRVAGGWVLFPDPPTPESGITAHRRSKVFYEFY